MNIERFNSEHIYREKDKIYVLDDLINSYFDEFNLGY